MANPNRKITEEQFAEGSTIDGTRIDKAFDDTYAKLNSIPKANLKQMMVPRMFYSGWQTGHFSATEDTVSDAFPLGMNFSVYNSFQRDITGNTGARTKVNNEWRWKGTRMNSEISEDIIAEPAGSTAIPTYNYSDVVGRTWSLYIEKPCIITDISIIFQRDVYTGLYDEGNVSVPTTPTTIPEFAHLGLKCWAELFLDSVFNADDKRKGSVLWRRVENDRDTTPMSDARANMMVPRDNTGWNQDRSNRIPFVDFEPDGYQLSPVGTKALSNHPNYNGWWDKNLNILVPQQSRLHLGFGFAINAPDLPPIDTYGEFDRYKLDDKFHLGYRYNIAIGFLEEVEK